MAGELGALFGLTLVDVPWWLFRLINMNALNGMSSEDLMLVREAFELANKTNIAEEAKTLALTAGSLSWAGTVRQWAWSTWSSSWVQGAVVGWILHVLIMDMQGEPRTWWGGRLQREQRDEETVLCTPEEKKISELTVD